MKTKFLHTLQRDSWNAASFGITLLQALQFSRGFPRISTIEKEVIPSAQGWLKRGGRVFLAMFTICINLYFWDSLMEIKTVK